MIIGITGTNGAGKGEKRILGASQDLVRYFLSVAKENIDKVYSVCKTPAPVYVMTL